MILHASRPPIHHGDFVDVVRPRPQMSRWVKGPTSFGPAGRLGITAFLVLLCGMNPSPFFLVPMLFASVIILRDVWKKERVPDDASPVHEQPRHVIRQYPGEDERRDRVRPGVGAQQDPRQQSDQDHLRR